MVGEGSGRKEGPFDAVGLFVGQYLGRILYRVPYWRKIFGEVVQIVLNFSWSRKARKDPPSGGGEKGV